MIKYLARPQRRTMPIFFVLSMITIVSNPTFALEMRSVVKDFVTTEWTLECPDGEILDFTTVALTDQGIIELFQCLGQIESEVGVNIESHTVVKDFVVESDEIISTVEMSEEQANKLKQIIDTHRIPSNPLPLNRPRIESVVVDGVLESFIIVLPDGCIIDLTDVNIDPQVLQQLIQLIQQIEAQNGVHVTGATTIKDGETEKDRVIQFTYLMPQQAQQLLQFFQSHGIALLLWQKQIPVEMGGVVDVNGLQTPFSVLGEVVIQLQPLDSQNNTIPIEIVAMDLKSVEPLTVTFGSGDPTLWDVEVMLQPVDHTGKLNLIAGQIPNLTFHNVGPNQDTLVADPDFPQEFEFFGCGPWPFHEAVRLHSLGHKHLVLQGPNADKTPAFVQINHFEFGLPLRVPVIPNGIGD